MRRYFLGWIVWFCVFLAGVALANTIIDPYSIYRISLVHGLNEFKPRAQQQGRLMKIHGLSYDRPRALILGNSRAEIGFDPQHRAWPHNARPAYNAALAGSSLAVALDFAARIQNIATPSTIVLGVDFKDFLFDSRKPPVPRATVTQQRPRWEQIAGKAKELSTTVLSLDALIDSMLTIKAQYDRYPANLRRDGFNPMHDYVGIAQKEGYYAMFRQRDLENAKAYKYDGNDLFAAGTRSSADFETLDEIIRLCRERGIALKLIIYPYHAHLLEMFQAAGLWDSFEQWKRALVARSNPANKDEKDLLVLWDFSGHHAYATEAIPPANGQDKDATMRWYWEAGHFKKELGDIVLERVLGNASGSADDGFGVVLTADNVEQHLAEQRESRRRYANTHPEDVREIETMIAHAKR